MNFNNNPQANLLAAAFVFTLAAGHAAIAQEQVTLSAHVHGTTQVQMALENGHVSIALQAPGADIVGFEHPAESPLDKAAIAAGLQTLSQPLDLFVPALEADCKTQSVRVWQVGGELHGEDAAGQGHEDHDHEDPDHEGHDHADDHDLEDGGEETHLEFHGRYILVCADLSAFNSLELPFFERFDHAREIHFQVLSAIGVHSYEVGRGYPSLTLKTGD